VDPLDGAPGPLDAITERRGRRGRPDDRHHRERQLVVGRGPVRTGVTAVLPRGKNSGDPVFAGWVHAERQRRK